MNKYTWLVLGVFLACVVGVGLDLFMISHTPLRSTAPRVVIELLVGVGIITACLQQG
jgi:hypothetical protein